MANDTENTEQLRAQAALLLSQAAAQSLEIGQALGAAAASSPLHAELSAAAERVSDAIRRLSSALQSSRFPLRQSDLMALQSVVSAPEIRGLIAEATSAQSSEAVRVQAVATAAAATRAEVQTDARDIFDRRIFDRYLRFLSREDEEEFRGREAATRKYIDEQLAKKTPEGDLNAAGGEQGYLLDAYAHGADASPEFTKRWDALAAKTAQQRDAMRAAGQSTAEYDHHVEDSVRRYLKQTGVPQAEIEDRIARAAHPVDAAGISGPAKPAHADVIDKVAATLKAAGVHMGDDIGNGHGLAAIGSGRAQEAPARTP